MCGSKSKENRELQDSAVITRFFLDIDSDTDCSAADLLKVTLVLSPSFLSLLPWREELFSVLGGGGGAAAVAAAVEFSPPLWFQNSKCATLKRRGS